MPVPYRVALLGFSPFERDTLASYFRLASQRSPCYALVQMLSQPDFMLADADHPPSVQLAQAEDMLARTVFIGTQAPAGATAWMRRPIDPLHVMRELDAMVAPLLASLAAAAAQVLPATESAASTDADSAASTAVHGDDLPTLMLPTGAHLPPAEPAPVVHGQRTVFLPRRFRRGTIDMAFGDDASSLSSVPALAQPVMVSVAAEHDAEAAQAQAQATGGDVDTVAVPAPPDPAQPPPALPPPCALLVDDSELARHFLARLLEPWGVVCDQASSSQQALQRLAERDYDFIFLDLELGAGSDLDGLSLCQQIKRLHSSVLAALATVVMVSAHHSEIDRVRGSLAGCDGYLGKPLKPEELTQLLLRQGLKPPLGVAARPSAATRPG